MPPQSVERMRVSTPWRVTATLGRATCTGTGPTILTRWVHFNKRFRQQDDRGPNYRGLKVIAVVLVVWCGSINDITGNWLGMKILGPHLDPRNSGQ